MKSIPGSWVRLWRKRSVPATQAGDPCGCLCRVRCLSELNRDLDLYRLYGPAEARRVFLSIVFIPSSRRSAISWRSEDLARLIRSSVGWMLLMSMMP